jgi:hypothetical protein
MKKTAGVLLLFACCVFAADVWQSKPYTEWSEKDAQKIMGNSPWARLFAISVNVPEAPPGFGDGDSARGRGTRGIADDALPSNGPNGGRLGGAVPANQSGVSTVVVARWQSALPIKEAFVRLKFGAAAATSPEAKQILDRQETSYAIVLSGPLESLLRGNPEELKRVLIGVSSLSAKGKGDLSPTDVQITATPTATEVLFVFPRSTAYTLDDKEVEFSTKLGGTPVKYRFRLKDMVFNGKLEL